MLHKATTRQWFRHQHSPAASAYIQQKCHTKWCRQLFSKSGIIIYSTSKAQYWYSNCLLSFSTLLWLLTDDVINITRQVLFTTYEGLTKFWECQRFTWWWSQVTHRCWLPWVTNMWPTCLTTRLLNKIRHTFEFFLSNWLHPRCAVRLQ